MIQIKIQDKNYDIPTEWKDMKLKYWYGLYNIINKHHKRDEEGNIIEEENNELQMLKMNKQIFMYLTGLSENQMSKLDLAFATHYFLLL